MRRVDLVRQWEAHGCQLLREGANHTVYIKRGERKSSTIPRHREINDYLDNEICRDLGIPSPKA